MSNTAENTVWYGQMDSQFAKVQLVLWCDTFGGSASVSNSRSLKDSLYVSAGHEIRYVPAETDSQSLPIGKFGVFTDVGSVDNF